MAKTGNNSDVSLRVGVVGCGSWGRNLVRNFSDLGALQVVCDVDTSVAKSLAREFLVEQMTFVELLASNCQGIVIAVPAEQHFNLAQEALLAGKHVFVEKPLALRVDEAIKLCDIAEEKELTLMVGHLLQYHPVFRRLKELVSDGELGRLQYIYSNRLNLGKFRREENILWSFAPHDISMILSLVGDAPIEVSAKGDCYLHKNLANVTVTNLSFASGVNAHVFVSWLHPYKEQKLIVIGDAGMAVFDDGQDWDKKLSLYPHRIEWQNGTPAPIKEEGSNIPVEACEPLKTECSHFLDCIETGEKPITNGWEAIGVLNVLDAAERSMKSKRIVKISDSLKAAEISSRPFIHDSACIDKDCEIGAGTKIWHYSHVLGGTRIGANCILGQNVMAGPDVIIGDGCKIQNNVSLFKGVTLEENVFRGPSAVFTNVLTPRAAVERKDEYTQTLVKKGASIGANATIICGNNIGKYAFIGAGAVVTHDIPDHALVVGNPARIVGFACKCGEVVKDTNKPIAQCPRCGQSFEFGKDGNLLRFLGS